MKIDPSLKVHSVGQKAESEALLWADRRNSHSSNNNSN